MLISTSDFTVQCTFFSSQNEKSTIIFLWSDDQMSQLVFSCLHNTHQNTHHSGKVQRHQRQSRFAVVQPVVKLEQDKLCSQSCFCYIRLPNHFPTVQFKHQFCLFFVFNCSNCKSIFQSLYWFAVVSELLAAQPCLSFHFFLLLYESAGFLTLSGMALVPSASQLCGIWGHLLYLL